MLPELATKPEVRELVAQTQALFEVGSHYAVVSVADYEVAGAELQRVKGAQKRLDDLRKSITRPIDAAKKAVMDFFREPEEKLARAESGIKRAMTGFQAEEDRRRREEQARADEAARKERARLQAIADETARKAREQAEAQRRAAEEAAAAGRAAEAQRLAAAAARTEEKAAAKAGAFESRAAAVVAPVISREPPKVIGVQTREVWKFEVMDSDLVPRQFLSVDEAKIRKVVGALKGDTRIEGVRIWSEKAIAAGSAA